MNRTKSVSLRPRNRPQVARKSSATVGVSLRVHPDHMAHGRGPVVRPHLPSGEGFIPAVGAGTGIVTLAAGKKLMIAPVFGANKIAYYTVFDNIGAMIGSPINEHTLFGSFLFGTGTPWTTSAAGSITFRQGINPSTQYGLASYSGSSEDLPSLSNAKGFLSGGSFKMRVGVPYNGIAVVHAVNDSNDVIGRGSQVARAMTSVGSPSNRPGVRNLCVYGNLGDLMQETPGHICPGNHETLFETHVCPRTSDYLMLGSAWPDNTTVYKATNDGDMQFGFAPQYNPLFGLAQCGCAYFVENTGSVDITLSFEAVVKGSYVPNDLLKSGDTMDGGKFALVRPFMRTGTSSQHYIEAIHNNTRLGHIVDGPSNTQSVNTSVSPLAVATPSGVVHESGFNKVMDGVERVGSVIGKGVKGLFGLFGKGVSVLEKTNLGRGIEQKFGIQTQPQFLIEDRPPRHVIDDPRRPQEDVD